MRCLGAWVLGCLGALVLCAGSAAFAQNAEAPALRKHRVTASGGVTWSGSYPIGEATATYRTNAPGNTPPPFTLFSAASTVDAVAGIEGRVGFTVTPDLAVEAGVSFARPRVGIVIASDAEVAPHALEGEELQQYIVDAGAVWQLPLRLSRRVRPFVTGGAGYLRQLHQERTLVETGQVYYAGGGLRYWLRGGSGATRSFGLRADARAMWKRDGVDFEDRTRLFPVVSVFAFMGF